jgi:hypothetical protein
VQTKTRAKSLEQSGIVLLVIGLAISAFFAIDMAAMETRWGWHNELVAIQQDPLQYIYNVGPILFLTVLPVVAGLSLVVFANVVRKNP